MITIGFPNQYHFSPYVLNPMDNIMHIYIYICNIT